MRKSPVVAFSTAAVYLPSVYGGCPALTGHEYEVKSFDCATEPFKLLERRNN